MNTPESPEIAHLQQRLSDMETRYQRYQERFPGAINRMDELGREVEALRTEVKRLEGERNSLLRCSKGHIHNQAYGRPCPICERDALRDGLERCMAAAKAEVSMLDLNHRSITRERDRYRNFYLAKQEECSLLASKLAETALDRNALRDGLEKLIMAAQSLTRNPDSWEDLTDALAAAQALLSHTQTESRPIQVGDTVRHRTEGWTGTVETSDGHIVGVNCKRGLYGVSQLERVEPERGEPAER